MTTEREVRALIAKLRAYDRGTDAVVIRAADLRAVADALEQLLPGFYLHPDSTDPSPYTDGWNSPAEALDPGEVRHLLPVTTWDDCWAARRGDEVRTFATYEEAEAWLEEGDAV